MATRTVTVKFEADEATKAMIDELVTVADNIKKLLEDNARLRRENVELRDSCKELLRFLEEECQLTGITIGPISGKSESPTGAIYRARTALKAGGQ
jgi:hypothetical protein